MKKPFIQRLVSFLTGLAWGVALFSFLSVFFHYYHSGVFTAFLLASLSFFAFSVFIVLFEYVSFRVTSDMSLHKKLDTITSIMEDDKLSNNRP